jgi:hypothetical protein
MRNKEEKRRPTGSGSTKNMIKTLTPIKFGPYKVPKVASKNWY